MHNLTATGRAVATAAELLSLRDDAPAQLTKRVNYRNDAASFVQQNLFLPGLGTDTNQKLVLNLKSTALLSQSHGPLRSNNSSNRRRDSRGASHAVGKGQTAFYSMPEVHHLQHPWRMLGKN